MKDSARVTPSLKEKSCQTESATNNGSCESGTGCFGHADTRPCMDGKPLIQPPVGEISALVLRQKPQKSVEQNGQVNAIHPSTSKKGAWHPGLGQCIVRQSMQRAQRDSSPRLALS